MVLIREGKQLNKSSRASARQNCYVRSPPAPQTRAFCGEVRARRRQDVSRTRHWQRVSERTLFVMLPLMLATRTMLPPFPKRAIWRPAACAVNSTPFTFTSITCGIDDALGQ